MPNSKRSERKSKSKLAGVLHLQHSKNHKIDDNAYIIYFGCDAYDIPLESLSDLITYENPILGLLMSTNLNPKFPQYHNVYCSSLSGDLGEIYINDDWKETKMDEIIDKVIELKLCTLKYMLREMDSCLSDEMNEYIINGINYVETAKNRELKTIRNEIRHALFEKSDMIMMTWHIVTERIIKTLEPISKKRRNLVENILFDLLDKRIPHHAYKILFDTSGFTY